MNKLIKSLLVLGLSVMSIGAQADLFTVSAHDNSTSGGVGLDTITLAFGQQFSVSVDPNDLWNAGAYPRWSNADGLVTELYSTGLQDTNGDLPSGVSGTHIGTVFPNWNQDSLTAPYGMLVGRIGGGNLFEIGTAFNGTAANAGVLKLYYFDSNNYDNSGSIVANVSSVPLPASAWLFVSAIAGLSLSRRKVAA